MKARLPSLIKYKAESALNYSFIIEIVEDSRAIQIVAYYRFVDLDNIEELREQLLELCNQQGIKGMILLAPEGINSTVSGTPKAIQTLFEFFNQDKRLKDLPYKSSYSPKQPFPKMRVRLKKEIVRMKIPNIDPREKVGTYVAPEDWNELIENPETTVVDVRNSYEYKMGTFKGAIDPETEEFWEFPDWVDENLPEKDKPIAMFCTGGIRCEKATSYLLHQGYTKVYHLQGGILNYIEKVEKENSTWEGECFVFDRRGTVDHDLAPTWYRQPDEERK